MKTLAARQLQSIRNSRAWKGTAGFLHWWRAELVTGLPPRWRAIVDHRPERLMVRQSKDEVLLWRDHNGHDELGRFHISDDLETAGQVIQAARGQLEEQQPRTIFLIENDQVLRKTVTLPAAAEENLRQVLAFEMDRHTPFKGEQIYFDCLVVGRNPTARTLKVELVVVRRETVDAVVEMSAERGLSLDAVDVCRQKDDGVLAVLDVNLLPEARRARRDRRRLKLNLGLAAMLLVLMYGVMWQSLLAREQAIKELRTRVGGAQVIAIEVNKLKDELVEAREAARFLTDKKSTQPVMLDLVAELTRLLPDETWLQRLQLNQETVVLTGQSPEAATLISLLEGAGCITAPSFKGAVTPDPRSGKERFTIEAQLRMEEECSDGPTAP